MRERVTPEQTRAREKAWCLANKERVIEHRRKARLKFKTENPEEYKRINREKNRRYYAANRDKQLKWNQAANLRRYGMTVADYDAMLAKQSGKCAICGRDQKHSLHTRLFVDHDHDTGVVRGLLCYRCNSALGQLGDNIEGVLRAVDYLRHAPKVCDKSK